VPVVPVARREVDLTGRLSGGDDRRDEEVGPEQVLVVEIAHGRVVLVVEHQRSLHRGAGLRRAHERGVDVRQQPVPQLDGVADEIEHGVAPGPGVAWPDTPTPMAIGMLSQRWSQRERLSPIQFAA
jgi:hypothetical protein